MFRIATILVTAVLSLSALGCTAPVDGDKIPLPGVNFSYSGMNHEDVVADFIDAGFTDVSTAEVADLEVGIFSSEGEFDSYSVDGCFDYDKSVLYEPDTPIVVYYHVFAEEFADDEAKAEAK